MTYDYFMTHRPPMPGAMPKNGLVDIEEYPEYGKDGYARLTYNRELTEDEIKDYELTPCFYNVKLTPKQVSYLRILTVKRGVETEDDDELANLLEINKALSEFL